MKGRLTRTRKNRMIAGVCGGIAEYANVDPTVVRLVWALLTLFPGTTLLGLVGYLAAWLIVPEAHGES